MQANILHAIGATYMLKITDLTIGYNKNRVLYRDLNFSIINTQILAIVGQNGSGKSTLLKSIAGIIEPQAGDVFVNQIRINNIPIFERAKLIAYLSQNQPELPPFNIIEFVSLGLYPYLGLWGKLKQSDTELLNQIFEQCQLTLMLNQRVDQLSGGEQQKVLIAKALAQKTPIILLDEPTTYLDLKAQIEFAKLIRYLSIEQNKCIVIVAHDLTLVREIADYVLLLGHNHQWIFGRTDEVLHPDYLEPAFELEQHTLDFMK